MNNMKKSFNEKLKQKVEKLALNAGENALDGRCWGMWYEPTIPEKLLNAQMERK